MALIEIIRFRLKNGADEGEFGILNERFKQVLVSPVFCVNSK